MNTTKQTQKKKRGRKPKGGKIVNKELVLNQTTDFKPSIILHLKCNSETISNNSFMCDTPIKPSNTFDINYNDVNDLNNLMFNVEEYNKNSFTNDINLTNDTTSLNTGVVLHGLSLTDYKNMIHNINNKLYNKNNIIKSDCFWCSHAFETPSIHIPKNYINDKYNVYGHFCSIECAAGFLFNEKVNMSEKFERYTLLNYLYKDLTKDNVVIPAPSPYYILNKFCGNMSIDEYRNIYTTKHTINCINKPNSLNVEFPEIYLQMNNDASVYNYDAISGGSFKIKKATNKTKNILDTYFNT